MSTKPHGAQPMRGRAHRLLAGVGCTVLMCAGASTAQADGWHHGHHGSELDPGNLLLSTSDYTPADITAGRHRSLPPGCATAPTGTCGTAVADGTTSRSVFNNDSVDGFFGVTSPVFLDELTPWGHPSGTSRSRTDQFVTSFSSKSELALNLSPEGRLRVVHGLRRAARRRSTSRTRTRRA